MPEIRLTGCAPTPLAHYLKALGILRLVAEQKDPDATGHWQRDVFVLTTSLDAEGLLNFFLHAYKPTPILAPWNRDSDFYSESNSTALESIANSTSPRFEVYRRTIAEARWALSRLSMTSEPDKKTKPQLLLLCRSVFPEEALPWLDTAYVLTKEGPKYSPLVGTGGSDGRQEFTNNFMQRLIDVIDPATGHPRGTANALLTGALFGSQQPLPLTKAPIGQFLPGQAGGANAASGFQGASVINPWDYILALEGCLLFASAAVRRLETTESEAMASPFCVLPAAAGYASSSGADEAKAHSEMWMPLWERPTRLPELAAILAEGRAQIRIRPARHGVDFARAIVGLGVDRGLTAFHRYGFHVRNGKINHFAIPLGRFIVRRNARADLICEVDAWLDTLRNIAGPSADGVPASVTRALRDVEEAILSLCQENSATRLQGVLIAFGRAEKALARSHSWAAGLDARSPRTRIPPLYGLSRRWLREADDGSVEFRLATALASITGSYKNREGQPLILPLRCHLEPVTFNTRRGTFEWDENPSNHVVWHEGDFVDLLNAIMTRRLLCAAQSGLSELPDHAEYPAPLGDVVAFLDHQTDDARLADLLWGLCLVDWSSPGRQEESLPVTWRDPCHTATPSALFSLLRLLFARPSERGSLAPIPLVPAAHRWAAAGNGLAASRLAAQRLRASDLAPALGSVDIHGEAARRAAAAILFPLSQRDLERLADLILKPQTQRV
jgi:CRISPR-associated protein Csx17